ncbi:RIP metalloprotease RseP [Umezakia ovalisporum]|jgi:membrane-associated protease RseP (regulator of RpoE activity)|uniref:Zinc metalloprotease n=2 Tax=Umezakia ovalisporum TaxID=75695 RepID=A0AA43GVL8_9CYAN|nr:RIP metalloprotease RseP [Umezakia ovalisporum]MBI1241347.1 RIP metalloprotease RseP [Nostoc sp. RI_552]MDH6055252.1 RIP metalloprotease RseP [Umezakia ovalisporum FSS-43]MDH6062454.1 RIP metalloprotease RseP [Umezakia ovalisporum FSS-62]MDH6067502.1 RIP metalloprotease RseP [Umezakia ovalisporum APH033B]MDH6070011.1 RIP metalloprotease RseP [Umezakia ovalisporum CobakiLakeA]
MSVLAAIAVLAVLILVHELGHFIAARAQGILVNRFSLGFGPTLWKYQGSQTEYAIRAFPLGGFVGFPDDEPDSDIPPNDPNLLRNRPIVDRGIVISAGVIANLIFAYLLLVTQVSVIGVGEASQPGVLIQQLAPDVSSVAREAGIKPGDVILAVNEREFGTALQEIEAFREIIKNNPGQPVKLEIARGDQKLTVNVIPENKPSGGTIGIGLAPNGEVVRRPVRNLGKALNIGANEFQRLVFMTFQGFGQLITNFGETASQVAGPIKIVQIGSNIAQNDTGSLLFFGALISINLAIINILPLPALDGGQLAFLLIEGVRGKPLPNRIQEGVMQTGLMILLGLGIFLIVKETTQLTSQLDWVQKLFQ